MKAAVLPTTSNPGTRFSWLIDSVQLSMWVRVSIYRFLQYTYPTESYACQPNNEICVKRLKSTFFRYSWSCFFKADYLADVQGTVPSTAALLEFRPGGYEAKAMFTTGFRKLADAFLLNMLAFVVLCRIAIKLILLRSCLKVEMAFIAFYRSVVLQRYSSLAYAYLFHVPTWSLGKYDQIGYQIMLHFVSFQLWIVIQRRNVCTPTTCICI